MYVCPCCREEVLRKSDIFECNNKLCNLSKKKFPIFNNIPILIPFGKKDCILEDSYSDDFINFGSKNREDSKLKLRIRKFLKNLIYGKNVETTKNYRYLADSLKKDSKILIIGGGAIGSGSEEFFSKCKKKSIKVDSIDIYFSENITAIADAHYLPFKDEFYDLIVIQAVLEHVVNPNRVVNEIYRILKIKGIVYAETPFMQSVHEGPYDFVRFSHSGHRWLFKNFDEISSGAHQGAFSSSLFILSFAVSGLIRNKLVGVLIRILFTRLCRFLDQLSSYKSNIDAACGTFFIGIKSTGDFNQIQPINIVKFYKGAQRK